jgi:hypothetical protein
LTCATVAAAEPTPEDFDVQCGACQFENLPGLTACARCRSPLELADVSVEPPRASRLRARTRVGRWLNRLRAGARALGGALHRLQRSTDEPLPRTALLWALGPGLAQIRFGPPALGIALLAAWLTLLGLGVASLGDVWGWTAWWWAVAVHAVGVLRLLAPSLGFERGLVRAGYGALLFLALVAGIYAPVHWLATRAVFVLPCGYGRGVYLAHVDEVFLVSGPWLPERPLQRGDLVAYTLDSVGGAGFQHAGYAVDRVVGVPGDRVEFRHGRISVNDRTPPAGERPVAPVNWPMEASWRVEPGEFLIFPSQLSVAVNSAARQQPSEVANLLAPVCRVRAGQVAGRILWRVRPWSRFGPVE